jgi:3,4-dihydroxy 2-butanone 4-phosphate synthase/GTP cyclohydrolase II
VLSGGISAPQSYVGGSPMNVAVGLSRLGHPVTFVGRYGDAEFGDFRAAGYSNIIDGSEHLALIKGEIKPGNPTLVRVHSECLTGDVFGSYRCECRPQLHAALSQIEREGNGVLLYMRQNGSGLVNKLQSYKSNEDGHGIIDKSSNEEDLREFGIGAQILKDLGISKMKLLTNNPRKIKGLKGYDLEVVETVPLQMDLHEEKVK